MGTYSSDGGSEFTEWLPTSGLTLQISGCSGGDAGAGFWTPTVGVLSEKGMFQSTPHSEATANPYPPGGQHFQLSLAEPSYLELGDVHLASCDRLEVRNSSGQTVWSWTPQVNPFTGVPDQKGYTTKLQGLVNVGIWGAGCNGTELQRGFMLTRVLSESPADAGPPVSIGLPGQKFRSDGTIDNWNRFYDPATGRYLSPEPLAQNPNFVLAMAQQGLQTPTYAYGLNNPLRYADPTGNNPLVLVGFCLGGGCEAALTGAAAVAAAIAAAGAGAYCGITGNCFPTPPPTAMPTEVGEPVTIPVSRPRPVSTPIPDVCAPPGPPGNCKEVAAQCRESCEDDLLSGGSFAFWRCVNSCLEAAGCPPGMY